MSLLPATQAGLISVGFALVHIVILALHVKLPANRVLVGLTVLSGIAVLPAAVDSITVHDERSVLVFAAMAIGVTGCLLAIGRTALRWTRHSPRP